MPEVTQSRVVEFIAIGHIVIPYTIKREHVLEAIATIKISGVPRHREPTKFYLIYDNRLYPPKYTLSVAAKYATGSELHPSTFSGGEEANSFLERLGFEIQVKRNDWSWRECYFAVWGYDQLDIDSHQVKVILYREVSELIGRTAKSVEFKIQNVASFDTRPKSEKPVAEAKNAQALLGNVFIWYWENKDFARSLYNQVVEEFKFNLATISDHKPNAHESITNVVIEEGAVTTMPSTRRKRSQRLIEDGRKYFKALDSEGKLRCKSCGFVTPDELEAEVVQLHHSEPIYEASESGRVLKLSDAISTLIPLCPTCHMMAHTSRPPLSLDAIKALKE